MTIPQAERGGRGPGLLQEVRHQIRQGRRSLGGRWRLRSGPCGCLRLEGCSERCDVACVPEWLGGVCAQVRDQENFILNDPSGRPETRRSGAAGTRRVYKVSTPQLDVPKLGPGEGQPR